MYTYILKNLNILNGLLLLAVILLIIFIAIPFFNMDIWLSIPKVPRSKIGQGVQTTVAANPSLAEYTSISEQNLFNPSRRIPPAGTEEKIVARPEIVLYGTLITGNTRIAFIEDKKAPKMTPGRGKRQIAARKGYNMNGYILQQIEPDRVVFAKGNDRIVVRLEDEGKRKKTKDKNGQVVNPQEAVPAAPPENPNESPPQMQPSIQEPAPAPKATGK